MSGDHTTPSAELGEFLKVRRAALTPQAVGLKRGGIASDASFRWVVLGADLRGQRGANSLDRVVVARVTCCRVAAVAIEGNDVASSATEVGVSHGAELAGSAALLLPPGVRHLDPEPAVFAAMLFPVKSAC